MPGKKYELPNVDFGSDLVRMAFELERLRGDFGNGSTPPAILAELHALFQIVTSVVSARIEGNRTTIYDALHGLDAAGSGAARMSDSIREIENLIGAIGFIESMDPSARLTHVFVRELHRRAVA